MNLLVLSFAIKFGSLSTLIGLFLVGIISDSGTFYIVKSETLLRFTSALLVASIDVILIYGLFGMILLAVYRKSTENMED